MKKKGAIELSIGTIVIIVLSMSMLILGMVLIKNIFGGATDVVDMSTDQIKNQVAGMFGETKKLILLPDTKRIEIESGSIGAFAIGIQNRFTGSASTIATFDYEIKVADVGNCPISADELRNLITVGDIDPVSISPGGEPFSRKITLTVPEGTPLCTFSYQIDATHSDGQPYATDFMDVTIVA